MSDNIEEHIRQLNQKLQLLIKNYATLKKENESLRFNLEKVSGDNAILNSNIESMQQKILILRASVTKMGEEEKRQFERKLDNYIKDIDKCITVLSK